MDFVSKTLPLLVAGLLLNVSSYLRACSEMLALVYISQVQFAMAQGFDGYTKDWKMDLRREKRGEKNSVFVMWLGGFF